METTPVDSNFLEDSNLLSIAKNSEPSLNDSISGSELILPTDIQPEIPRKYLDSGIQHNGNSQFDEDNEVDLPTFDRENASINGLLVGLRWKFSLRN